MTQSKKWKTTDQMERFQIGHIEKLPEQNELGYTHGLSVRLVKGWLGAWFSPNKIVEGKGQNYTIWQETPEGPLEWGFAQERVSEKGDPYINIKLECEEHNQAPIWFNAWPDDPEKGDEPVIWKLKRSRSYKNKGTQGGGY